MLKNEKNNIPYFEKVTTGPPKSKKFKIFNGFIKNMLFQDSKNDILEGNSRVFIMPEKNINIINYIIVYTNIIEPQFYGNRMSKILRSLPVKVSQNGELTTIFNNNHYVNVSSTFFDSINKEIRDIFGNLIQFTDFFSYVIVNLHFRPKVL